MHLRVDTAFVPLYSELYNCCIVFMKFQEKSVLYLISGEHFPIFGGGDENLGKTYTGQT